MRGLRCTYKEAHLKVHCIAISALCAIGISTGCAPTTGKQSESTTTSGRNAAATIPATSPSITGTVTAVGPGRSLRIEEVPGEASGSQKAQVRVPDGVVILDRSGQTRTLVDIHEGAIVSAWFTGPVAESYPVQATASAIVIEPPAPRSGGGPTGAAVNYMGFGALRAGMTVAEAEQALGAKLPLLGPSMEPCHYVSLQGSPGVAFMVIDGRIARVDVQRESPIKTAEGAGIGDPEDRIRALYPGTIETQPHKYSDGNYLIVRAPADSNYRIIFETDGKRVTSYRAGRMPEVRWVEGCS